MFKSVNYLIYLSVDVVGEFSADGIVILAIVGCRSGRHRWRLSDERAHFADQVVELFSVVPLQVIQHLLSVGESARVVAQVTFERQLLASLLAAVGV